MFLKICKKYFYFGNDISVIADRQTDIFETKKI